MEIRPVSLNGTPCMCIRVIVWMCVRTVHSWHCVPCQLCSLAHADTIHARRAVHTSTYARHTTIVFPRITLRVICLCALSCEYDTKVITKVNYCRYTSCRPCNMGLIIWDHFKGTNWNQSCDFKSRIYTRRRTWPC